MNPQLIQQTLLADVVAHGGHEKRSYLGMSNIAAPEDELLAGLLNGSKVPDETGYQRLALGYEWEAIVRGRLLRAGLLKADSQREIIAAFDARFKGHTDGEFISGELLEIKSTTDEALEALKAKGRCKYAHFAQVQMYLHHGGYDRAFVVYIARDTGRWWVAEVRYNRAECEKLNTKARAVLARFDETSSKP